MIGRRNTPKGEVEPNSEELKGFDDFDLLLGDVMRGERATLGKSLLDVQRELKIRATYISAIEHADPSAFETPGFVAGYVRSYARYLGLDPEWAYKKFCQEGNFEVVHGMEAKASTAKSNRPRKKADPGDPLANPNATFVPQTEAAWSRIEPGAIGSVLVLLVLISGLGFGGYSVLQQVQRVDLTPVDQAPGVVAQVDSLEGADIGALAAVDTDPTFAAPSDEALMTRLYRPRPLDVPVLVPRDGPIATLQPGALGALASTDPLQAPRGIDPIDVAVADALLEEQGPPIASSGVQVVEDNYPEVAVAALAPAWVRVTAPDGTVLLEKILDAGESYDLPALAEPPVLRAGNSGAVFFVVNGQAYGPAAPGAQVVKNVALAAADLKSNYEAVDPTLEDVATMVADLRLKWDEDAVE